MQYISCSYNSVFYTINPQYEHHDCPYYNLKSVKFHASLKGHWWYIFSFLPFGTKKKNFGKHYLVLQFLVGIVDHKLWAVVFFFMIAAAFIKGNWFVEHYLCTIIIKGYWYVKHNLCAILLMGNWYVENIRGIKTD